MSGDIDFYHEPDFLAHLRLDPARPGVLSLEGELYVPLHARHRRLHEGHVNLSLQVRALPRGIGVPTTNVASRMGGDICGVRKG